MQKKKAFFFSYPSALYLRRSQNYEKSRAIPLPLCMIVGEDGQGEQLLDVGVTM